MATAVTLEDGDEHIHNIQDLTFFFSTLMLLVLDLDKVSLDITLSERQHISEIKVTFIQQMGRDVLRTHSTIKFSERHDRAI